MRKLLFALIVTMMGAFAFAGGTPANAMTAGAVTGMSDIVKPSGSVDQVHYRRYRHHHRHWGHRRHYRWGGYRHHRQYRHHRYGRHCWWRYGRRYCRY